ncbi:MAG: FISUMP domain-containing protein [Candidatus Gracilibacteria bacterium]|nr:FISUMP domain-containing protein [Candidatus Gracilibacteria bacterium]
MKTKDISPVIVNEGKAISSGGTLSVLNSENIPSFSRRFAGFTLVELIVVITILVILGTIAFTSLSGYSGNARDSSRVSDLTNLSKGLDIASIKTGSYPTPDNPFTITYSGGIIWTQGTIGDNVMNTISAGGARISKKPTDPLITSKEYTYSKLAYGNAYQIKTDWEGDSIAYRNDIIDQAQAASGNPTLSYIKGNYNGVVAKTQTGNRVYVFAIPSLFLFSGTGIITLSTTTATGFYLHGQTNSGGILFTPSIVFSSGSLPSTDPERQTLATGIANTYSGTVLASQSNIQPFIAAINPVNITTLASLGGSAVTNWLGGSAGGTPPPPPPAASWTVALGGDCTATDNTLGSDGNTSTCIDNRTYTMQGGATHNKTYNLLKIAGKWWFNQNLAYPPAAGYQGSNTWATTDLGYYSCPGNNSTTTVDCSLVSTLGYLYQWSAATGVASNNNDTTTLQGICPVGWHIPKKSDFATTSSAYWPDPAPASDNTWLGNTTGWTPTFVGCRNGDAAGTFYTRTTAEYVWSSLEISSAIAWDEYFHSSYPSQSYRGITNKVAGFSVRCLKN